jgi:ABC-type dipeptide/oligopeptide/nickel transport system permease component
MIPTVLGVSLIVFLMMHFIPGDPISILMGDYYTPAPPAQSVRALARAGDHRRLGALHHRQSADLR